ncbi:MAG: hypothetical protein JWN68_3748, partial [Nocardioides sp.]|nr:hypothetical protein [Nocardioides sp.]
APPQTDIEAAPAAKGPAQAEGPAT